MLIVPSFRVSVTRTMGFGEKIKARMKVDLVVVGMFRYFFSVFQMQKNRGLLGNQADRFQRRVKSGVLGIGHQDQRPSLQGHIEERKQIVIKGKDPEVLLHLSCFCLLFWLVSASPYIYFPFFKKMNVN